MDATAQKILTDTGKGMLVGGLPGAVVGAGIGIVGSGALAQGQAVATRYAAAKDHKTHLGGGLTYNILHKYKWLSSVARLEDQYDVKNEAVARSEFSSAVAGYQGLTKYPLFDVWGGLCLGGSEIMDAGSNFASLVSFAAELLGVGLIAAAFVSMGVTLPAAAAIEETGKMIGLVSDGLGMEGEMAKREYLSYRAAKAGSEASPEKNEIIAQMAETNTDILGTTVKSIIDVFTVIGIPKTLNFGKLKKSATALGRMPGWIRKAESFAAQAVGPLLKFAGRIKPWVLTAKKLLVSAYKIESWIAKILSAYGDAKKFLKNTGDLAKQLGHGAGAAYRGAKRLGGSAIASVKEYGSEALNFLKRKFGQAKTLGLSAEKYAGGKIHRAEHWIGEEAHDSGQWMLQNREWIGDALHEASTIFGVLAAGLGVTALVVPPMAPFLVPASLTFGAAATAARAWHSTSLAVGTIDGSVSPEMALNEAKWAAVDTALSVATVGVSNARFIARATTVPGMKAVAPTLNNPAKTAVTLNHILQQTNKLFGLKLGLILRNPKLASRLGWVSKALATAKFVKKLVEMGTSRLLGTAHGVAHGIAGGAKSAWNFAKDTGTGLRHWGEQRAHQAGEFFHNLKEKYYPSPKHDNASGSAAQDIGQCATDKFGILGMGMRNAATNTLAGVIGRHGSPTAKNGGLDLHAHSQSGMSVSEAFRQLKGKRKDVRGLDVPTFGNAAWSLPTHLLGYHNHAFGSGVIPTRGGSTAGIGALLRTPFNQSNPFLGLRGMVSTPDAHSQGGMSVSEAFHSRGGMSVSEAFHSRGGMSVSEAFRSQGGISVSEAFRQLKGKGKDVRALPFLTGREPNTVWGALDRGVRGGSSGLERGLRGSGTTLDTGLRVRGQDLDTGWRNSAAVYGSTARLGGGMLDHRLSRIGSGAVKAGRSGANAVDDSFDAAKALQRNGYGDHPDVNPAALRANLRRQSGGFLPDGDIRAKLGGHLGFDPGGARLHTGPAAASASRRLNAEAFTIGNDVFFGEGRFDPHTPKGLGLIAHELTHVGQQTGTTGSKARFFTEAGGDQMEREAQHTAENVLANAGSRSGLFVEDYVREYEGDGGLTQADQQRLDRISVLALREAERMLEGRGVRGGVNAGALEVQVEIDLKSMGDGEAARVWAEAILFGLKSFVAAPQSDAGRSVAVQRFEGGEHKWLGDEGYTAAMRVYIDKQLQGVPEGQRAALRAQLEQRFGGPMHRQSDGKAITYGSGVGLSGDFYETPEQLYKDKDGYVNNTNVSGIVGDFEQERDHALKGNVGGQYKDFNADYVWKSKNYVDLAVKNTPHFGGHNLETYLKHHLAAISLASQAHAETDAVKQQALWEKARFTNAFADHFLNDAFSAGHMRVPRQEIIDYFQSQGISAERSGLMSKILHDYDNKHGVAVTNTRGDAWTTFGDDYLFADLDPTRAKAYQVTPGAASPTVTGVRTGRDMAMEAVESSVMDLMTPMAPAPRRSPTMCSSSSLSLTRRASPSGWKMSSARTSHPQTGRSCLRTSPESHARSPARS